MLIRILLALIVLVVVLAGGTIARNKVPLWQPPGPFARLLAYLSTNSAETDSRPRFPELRSRSYPVTRGRMLKKVKAAITGLGWKIRADEDDPYVVHAVVSSPLLKFKDDLYVTLRQAPDEGTVVDVTSRSRIGRADFGANLGHILALNEALGDGA